MSFVPTFIQDNVKLTAKSSNHSATARFASTLDDAYLLIVANNCNNYFYNDNNNAAIIGAKSSNDQAGTTQYETYIGAKSNNVISKIARFNSEAINLDTNTIVNGNFMPSTSVQHDIGSVENRWRDLYLSGNSVYLNDTVISSDSNTNSLIVQDNDSNRVPMVAGQFRMQTTVDDNTIRLSERDSNLIIATLDSNDNLIKELDLSAIPSSSIVEDTNLFYTPERVATIVSASNEDTSNYVQNTSNDISDRVTVLDSNVSNFVTDTASTLNQLIEDKVADTDSNMSNFVISTSNVISTRITDLDLDQIAQGVTNKYIIDNVYDGQLNVTGELRAGNLVVEGTTTTINTATYQTENLDIVTEAVDGPGLQITQSGSGTNDIFIASFNDETKMVLQSSGNVGIGKTPEAGYKLDVDGTIRATELSGDGANIRNIYLGDRNTTLLAEGTNLYYTASRVGAIASASNVESSNYVRNTSNEISERVTLVDSNMSNYLGTTTSSIELLLSISSENVSNLISATSNASSEKLTETSNLISSRITNLNSDVSNYVLSTSNSISDRVTTVVSDTAANLTSTSNTISERVTIVRDYAVDSSNAISDRLTTVVSDTAANLTSTSNTISDRLTTVVSDTAANLTSTSNTISDRLTTVVSDTAANLTSTSNVISDRITTKDSNSSNYVLDTSNVISARISTLDTTTSNYIQESSNALAIAQQLSDSNLTARLDSLNADNSLSLTETSNTLVERITLGDTNASNFVVSTSDTLSDRITSADTNASNFVIATSNVISERITDLSADVIADGSVNRFIVNNAFQGDISVVGTLTTNNLDVTGTTTTINTASYTTENISIVTTAPDGAALTIDQTGTGDNFLLDAKFDGASKMVIESTGNVGIGMTNPGFKLDVDGTVNATNLKGDGSLITDVNLSDKFTTDLAEGTNLYYTASRVGAIASASNVETSNYVLDTSNVISNRLSVIDSNMTSYIDSSSTQIAGSIEETSNTLVNRITATDSYMSNYVVDTSNVISDRVTTVVSDTAENLTAASNVISSRVTLADTNMSNYVVDTSNVISDRMTTVVSDTAENLTAASNAISSRVTATDSNMSNYVSEINSALTTRIDITDSNMSNYMDTNSASIAGSIETTSNVISNRVSELDVNVSNYVASTSNDISDRVTTVVSDTAANLTAASNVISNRVTTLDTFMSNYVDSADTNASNFVIATSNVISDRITDLNADVIADGSVNRFIVNNAFQGDISVVGTLTTNNLDVTGTTTTINTASYTTENISIVTTAPDGAALTIDQTGTGDNFLLDAKFDGASKMVIESTGNVGIGMTNPGFKLDVDGTVNATNLKGDGSLITDVNLSDKFTTDLAEGTNLYYTASRVGAIASASNVETSNYVLDTSNVISNRLTIIDSNMTSYIDSNSTQIEDTSNTLVNRIKDTDSYMSNYVVDTSNVISNRVTTVVSDTAENLTAASNVISSRVTTVDANMSNYVVDTSGVINARITLTDENVSNYVLASSNAVSIDLHALDSAINFKVNLNEQNRVASESNMSNYITTSDVNISNYVLDTSNAISERVDVVDFVMSNYMLTTSNDLTYLLGMDINNLSDVMDASFLATDSNLTATSNSISSRVTDLDSNMSNFVITTSNVVSERIDTLNLDQVQNGATNKYIIDDTYTGPLLVTGLLKATNLEVMGTTTTINTSTYQTENLSIVSESPDGPALSIVQNNNTESNLFEAYTGTDLKVVMESGGNVGIGVVSPGYKLDVDGTVNALNLKGDGSLITDVNLSDKLTTDLAEGTNLYYTASRVGAIASASNVETSNYVLDTSNVISERLTLIDFNIINYIDSNSTIINGSIEDTSNTLIDRMNNSDIYASNYILETSNAITDMVKDLDSNMLTLDTYMSNYVDLTSNAIEGRLTDTSNLLISQVGDIDENMSNFVIQTSNNVTDHFGINDINMSNYVIDTSNDFIGRFDSMKIYSNLDDITQGNVNKYIVNNVFNDNLFITGKLMVTSLEIADLEYILEQEGTCNIGNFHQYIDVVSSNLIQDRLETTSNEIMANLQLANDAMNSSPWTVGSGFIEYDSGTVGIGIQNPNTAYKLHVDGDAFVDGTIRASGDIISSFSDMRLKTKVGDIEDSLEKIMNITTFKYVASDIAKSMNITDTSVQVGVSAQDVQSVLPEIVKLAPFDSSNIGNGEYASISGNNFLTVAYERLVPLLIEGIKELKREVDLLKNK
jgi:hypothetical protein